MSGTIVDDHACAKNLMPYERPLLARRLETLIACKKELLADGAASNLLLEAVGVERAGRLHPAADTGESSGATCLFFEGVVEGDALCDGLAVGDLRLPSLAVTFVFAPYALDIDIKMQFAHARDDSFLGFWVDMDTESGVFALKAVHGFGEGCPIARLFGLDGEGDNGFWYEHGGLCMN